jgi:cyclomaltodextrinase
MDDFIFGTLSTNELRLEQVRVLRAGITHNQQRTPRAPLPGQTITLDLTIGPDHPHTIAWIYWTNDGSDPDGEYGFTQNGYCTPMEFVKTEWDLLLWGYVRHFRGVLPAQVGGTILRYRIAAETQGIVDEITTYADHGAFYACHISDHTPPTWTYDAVIYQIFSERFNPGKGRSWLKPTYPSGFYGGTLRGITAKLDYLVNLGVNTLWLTPIFASPSHHGYDTIDFFSIEPRLGTKEDLKELIDSAHTHNIRILLDFVPNHVSHQHPFFTEACHLESSPYHDWFIFTHWPDKYETFFGVETLPMLNLRYPAARQHVLDAAAYWLNIGVDGFRVDYTAGPTPDFWAEFHRVTRQVNPDCWTFGEMVYPSDQQLQFEGGLDGCLDFILLEAFRQTFAYGRWNGIRFASFLDGHESFFPTSFSRPSFLDNHDMNRILWITQHAEDPTQAFTRLKLAALCQFTLAGQPIIYYGTEIGLSQERDIRQGDWGIPEEARLPMPWDKPDLELYNFYCRLIALRRSEPALRWGKRQTIHASEATIAYLRSDGVKNFLIALNLSNHTQSLPLSIDWKRLCFVTDPSITLNQGQLFLPPLGGAVLEET